MDDGSLVYVNRGPATNGNGYVVDLIKNDWQRIITYTGYINPYNENCLTLYPRTSGEGRVDKQYYQKHQISIFDKNYKIAY